MQTKTEDSSSEVTKQDIKNLVDNWIDEGFPNFDTVSLLKKKILKEWVLKSFRGPSKNLLDKNKILKKWNTMKPAPWKDESKILKDIGGQQEYVIKAWLECHRKLNFNSCSDNVNNPISNNTVPQDWFSDIIALQEQLGNLRSSQGRVDPYANELIGLLNIEKINHPDDFFYQAADNILLSPQSASVNCTRHEDRSLSDWLNEVTSKPSIKTTEIIGVQSSPHHSDRKEPDDFLLPSNDDLVGYWNSNDNPIKKQETESEQNSPLALGENKKAHFPVVLQVEETAEPLFQSDNQLERKPSLEGPRAEGRFQALQTEEKFESLKTDTLRIKKKKNEEEPLLQEKKYNPRQRQRVDYVTLGSGGMFFKPEKTNDPSSSRIESRDKSREERPKKRVNYVEFGSSGLFSKEKEGKPGRINDKRNHSSLNG